MRIESLVERLSADLRPIRPRSILREAAVLFILGLVELAAFLAMGFMRPDMPVAMAAPSFWWKLASTGLIAVLGAGVAIISIDPSRRKSGGALLGDRIRMNAIGHPNIYMRSLATRDANNEISRALPDAIAACRLAGFDLVIVETSGIGQGNAAIVPHVDLSLYSDLAVIEKDWRAFQERADCLGQRDAEQL